MLCYRINDQVEVPLENLEAVRTTEDGQGLRIIWRDRLAQEIRPVSADDRSRFFKYLASC
ncbi:MAG: hypothetical protein OEV94_04815 [Deltaproteobacteria bacterium]|nr:hypothetical protein [Deltaproteobacteria bacterium]